MATARWVQSKQQAASAGSDGAGRLQQPTAPAPAKPRWTQREQEKLREAVEASNGAPDWKRIAEEDLAGHGRSDAECFRRWQQVLEPGLVKVRCALSITFLSIDIDHSARRYSAGWPATGVRRLH